MPPGPDVARHTPSLPVDFAYPVAMKAAASSCATRTNRIRSSFRRRPSMIPLMPSPGRPKTVSTPQSINRSTRSSEAILLISSLLPESLAATRASSLSPSRGHCRGCEAWIARALARATRYRAHANGRADCAVEDFGPEGWSFEAALGYDSGSLEEETGGGRGSHRAGVRARGDRGVPLGGERRTARVPAGGTGGHRQDGSLGSRPRVCDRSRDHRPHHHPHPFRVRHPAPPGKLAPAGARPTTWGRCWCPRTRSCSR